MSINCRGHVTRVKIVQDYEVQPEARIKLLANQSKYSDAGRIIENEYYIFSAKRKSDGQLEIIQCGMGAASDFLSLIKHQGLPIFNPLIGDGNTERGSKGDKNKKYISSLKNELWNETAKQLYNAIMWLIILWDAKPDTPLFDFKDDVIKYKKYEPFESKIKRVNTTIKNGGKGKTLTDMIDNYRKHNKFRNDFCNFELLEKKINNMRDKKGNEIKSYF